MAREPESDGCVLLDDEDGESHLAIRHLDRTAQLTYNHRRQSEGEFVDQQQVRQDSIAQAIDSICRSPPER